MSEKKQVISDENALNELELFINEWLEKPEDKDKIQESFPYIFEALTSGNLIIDDNQIPKFNLYRPIKNDDGEISVSEINFKTRIVPSTQAKLGKGLIVGKDQLQYGLNCISYITGQPIAMIDKFNKKDYSTIREIASLFI